MFNFVQAFPKHIESWILFFWETPIDILWSYYLEKYKMLKYEKKSFYLKK